MKSFGRVLKILWQKYMNQNLQMHRMVLALLKLNCQMEQILAENKAADALPTACAAKLCKPVNKLATCNAFFFHHFAAEDSTPVLFTVSAKLHALVHISALAAFINPCRVWCFLGEDYMHVCKVLCQQCCHGTTPY